MNIRLVKLSNEYKKHLTEMMDEWTATNERIVPFAIRKNDYHDFEYYLEHLEIKEEVDGKVPDSTFFCLDVDRDIFVGAVNVRHYLTEEMLINAGHIGDGIRPSERRKGYAKEMLEMALPYCKEIGIDKVLITCIDTNIGSEKTILANGGVYESMIYEPERDVYLKRFWIILD